MRHHMIEETFRAIQPKQKGVPSAPAISVASTGDGASFSGALSQAAQEIAQLRQAYQAQANLIQANTQAIEKTGTSNQGSSGGVLSSLGGLAEKIFGGSLLGIPSLISGISDLFGGGASTPPPLPLYTPAPSIQLNDTIRNGAVSVASAGASSMVSDSLAPSIGNTSLPSGNPAGTGGASGISNGLTYQPQVTVQIQALDSQSIMARSSDIADAVREAVLNLHPLSSVMGER